MTTGSMHQVPVHIDLAAVDPGTGDPAAVFGKNAADLVDIDFFPFSLFHHLHDGVGRSAAG